RWPVLVTSSARSRAIAGPMHEIRPSATDVSDLAHLCHNSDAAVTRLDSVNDQCALPVIAAICSQHGLGPTTHHGRWTMTTPNHPNPAEEQNLLGGTTDPSNLDRPYYGASPMIALKRFFRQYA